MRFMNSTLVKSGDSSRKAFVHGFFKGLASPLMLFASNRAHFSAVDLPPLPQIQPIRLPRSITTMTDMERIGLDFWAAVRRHEQEGAQQSTAEPQRG